MLTILIYVAVIALIIASFTDIKTREVPDWLNFSLIFIGLGIRLIYSIAEQSYKPFLSGLFGFVAMLILAYIMFYAGQWGGGDSKILMGLGALIGLELSFNSMLVSFLINALIIGAICGLAWSIMVALKNRKRFSVQFISILKNKKYVFYRRIILVISLLILIYLFFVQDILLRTYLLMIIFVLILTQYLLIFVKAVEKSCMLKYVSPEQLTEGDWIARDVKISGKRICGPKDLGIEKPQIRELIKLKKKGKIKKILIKVGIPFVPSFLIAFVIAWLYGNVLVLLL